MESITENENRVQILNNWMEAQEERLKTLQKPESVISMQKMLLACQVRRPPAPMPLGVAGLLSRGSKEKAKLLEFLGVLLQTPMAFLMYSR